MNKNEISLRFSISEFDDITHKDITDLLGHQPDFVRNKGEKKNPKNANSPLIGINTWTISSGSDRYSDFDIQLNALLDILETKVEVLKPLCEKYYCEISCGMFIYFDNAESTPWVHFDARYYNLIKELNINFDLDMYVLPNE